MFFIILIFNAFNLPEALMYFLIIGQVPGLQSSLSPEIMLAIVTLSSGIIIFELFARNIEILHHTKKYFRQLSSKQSRLPKKRFERITPAN